MCVRYLTPHTDIFSLGIVAYEIYRFNIQLTPHNNILAVINNEINYHLPSLTALEILDFSFLPPSNPGSGGGIKEILISMLQKKAENRKNTEELSNHPFFVSGPFSFLRNIDALPNRDVGTQSAQLISLPQHMSTFPTRILERTVLPTICKICQSNPALWIHALSIHIYLTERMSVQKYKGE